MSEPSYMTAAGLEALRAEIERLETHGRHEIAEQIKTARAWGDLKENAEYHAAKEDAAMLELKIERLRGQLRSAEIVEAASGAEGAGMGSKVTYTDETSGRQVTHTLVAAVEARPGDGMISIASPVGRTLAGATPGDRRKLETPQGERSLKIVAVEHS